MRRWSTALVLILALVAINLVISSSASPSRKPVGLRVSSTALPPDGPYTDVAAVGGRIVVSGGTQGGFVRGRLTGTCHSVTLDPADLRVLATRRGNCADPALYGRRVLPVSYVAARRSPLFALALRIAVSAPHAREGYRLGRVVLRYPQCSDCRLESLYGDGALWIYSAYAAPSTKMTARSGTLLRVSESTGRVLQRWHLPSFARAELAVDADGVWIAQSLYGGEPAHLPAAQLAAYRFLYRVAPGMRAPAREFPVGTGGAYWLVAADHTVWLAVAHAGQSPSYASLWRLGGPHARPLVAHRRVASGPQCGELGEGPTSTVADPQTGVFCLALGPHGDHLQSFDFMSGAPHATQVTALEHASIDIYYAGPQSTAVLGSSAYFLFGPHRLYRALSG